MDDLDMDFMSSVLSAFDTMSVSTKLDVDATIASASPSAAAANLKETSTALRASDGSCHDTFASVQDVHEQYASEIATAHQHIVRKPTDVSPAVTDSKASATEKKKEEEVVEEKRPDVPANKPAMPAPTPAAVKRELKSPQNAAPNELEAALLALRNMPLSPKRKQGSSASAEAEQKLADIKKGVVELAMPEPPKAVIDTNTDVTPEPMQETKPKEEPSDVIVEEEKAEAKIETNIEKDEKEKEKDEKKEEVEGPSTMSPTISKARAMYLNRKKVARSPSALLSAIGETNTVAASDDRPQELPAEAPPAAPAIVLDMSMLGISDAEKTQLLYSPAAANVQKPNTKRDTFAPHFAADVVQNSDMTSADLKEAPLLLGSSASCASLHRRNSVASVSGTLKRRLSRMFKPTFDSSADITVLPEHEEAPRARQESSMLMTVSRRKSFFGTLKRNKTVSSARPLLSHSASALALPFAPASSHHDMAEGGAAAVSRYNTIRGDRPKGARLPSAETSLRSSFEELVSSRDTSSDRPTPKSALPQTPSLPLRSKKEEKHYDGTMTIRRSQQWAEKLAALKSSDSALQQWRDVHSKAV